MFALLEIFFRPARVFEAIRTRPRWALPFLATVFLCFATTTLFIQMATMELITLQRFQQDARLSERVGQASIDKAVDSSNTRLPKMIVISRSTAVAAVLLLLVAGILMVSASAMEAEPRPQYTKMLAMTSFAVFPFALLRLVATGLLLGGGGDVSAMDLDHLVSLSPAQLLDTSSLQPVMRSLVYGFDLIVFAQVFFLAYGFSKVAALPFLRCLLVCTALWVVSLIWTAAIAVWF